MQMQKNGSYSARFTKQRESDNDNTVDNTETVELDVCTDKGEVA